MKLEIRTDLGFKMDDETLKDFMRYVRFMPKRRVKCRAPGLCWHWTGPVIHNCMRHNGSNAKLEIWNHTYPSNALIPGFVKITTKCGHNRCVNPEHMYVPSIWLQKQENL